MYLNGDMHPSEVHNKINVTKFLPSVIEFLLIRVYNECALHTSFSFCILHITVTMMEYWYIVTFLVIVITM